MLYQFTINLTEEDYFAFNRFHATESSFAKKNLTKNRILFLIFMIAILTIYYLDEGISDFFLCYSLFLLLTYILFSVFYKKLIIGIIKNQIKQMKKSGKLPFDPTATIEFYDDKFVEITDTARMERKYEGLERICMVRDSYIILYVTSAGGNILPIPQLRSQTNMAEFTAFLSNKCSNIEYYY